MINLSGRESVKRFAALWLRREKESQAPLKPPVCVEGATTELLYRDGCYQVERCTLRAHTEIPDHVHPHIDSVELFVTGYSAFRIAGRVSHPLPGDRVRVRPGDVHGATVGATGVVFLSLQRWINRTPSHVLDDWRGATMGPSHKRRLG